MANEPTATVTGNLTADPELRFTPAGRPVASFTIANTPRYPDRTSGEWKDGETWFVPCSAWGDLAENIAASLTRGNAVTAFGRFTYRAWEKDGEKRGRVEMTVDNIGADLRRNVAKVTKVKRDHPAANGTGPAAPPAADPFQTAASAAGQHTGGGYDDAPPF
jgi:single-strand DNA-binding protein